MPKIPEYRLRVGMETAVAPQVEGGFLSDTWRATAQLGGPIAQIGDLVQALQNQAARTEQHQRDVSNSRRQNDLILTQFGNERWINQNVGEGQVMRSTGRIGEDGLEVLEPTGAAKIPISEFAQRFEQASNKIIDDEYAKFKYSPGHQKEVWLSQARMNQNRQVFGITTLSIKLSQQESERAIKAKAEEMINTWAGNGGSPEGRKELKEQLAGLLTNSSKVGDLDQKTAAELQAFYFKQIDKMGEEQDKATMAADDQADTLVLSQKVVNEEVGLDEALAEQAKNPRYVGRNAQMKAEQARLKDIIAGDREKTKESAMRILGEFSAALGQKQPYKILDALADPKVVKTLNTIDPGLINTWQTHAYTLIDRMAKGKDVFDEGDDGKWLEIWEKIRTNPKQIDPIKDIMALGGKGPNGGLSKTQLDDLMPKYDRAMAELRPGEPGKVKKQKPLSYVKGEEAFERLFATRKQYPEYKRWVEDEDKTTIRRVHRQQMNVILEWNRFYEAHSDENGDWTIDEKRVQSEWLALSEHEREAIKISWLKYASGGLGKFIPGVGLYKLATFPLKRKKLEARATVKALQADGAWDYWTEEQQGLAEKLAQQGVEINELISRVNEQ